jgi:uncharacterized membrane protein SirB2
MPRIVRLVLTVQAVYYLITGIWPILHMASFEAVSGPKTDDWLVRMVALLVVVIGATLWVAVRRRTWSREIRVLAIGSALAFAAIDIRYALGGRISPIYLADAGVELAIVALLLTYIAAPAES